MMMHAAIMHARAQLAEALAALGHPAIERVEAVLDTTATAIMFQVHLCELQTFGRCFAIVCDIGEPVTAFDAAAAVEQLMREPSSTLH